MELETELELEYDRATTALEKAEEALLEANGAVETAYTEARAKSETMERVKTAYLVARKAEDEARAALVELRRGR